MTKNITEIESDYLCLFLLKNDYYSFYFLKIYFLRFTILFVSSGSLKNRLTDNPSCLVDLS